MTAEEKLQYRLKLFDDVMFQRKMDRVPHIYCSGFWAVHDYGVTLTEAGNDFALMEKINRSFLDKYQFDTMLPFGLLFCNPRLMIEGIGEGYNVWNDDAGIVSLKDLDLVQTEDYDAFNENLLKYLWETALPRKFPNWKNLTIADFMSALGHYGTFGAYLESVMTTLPTEYGMPNIFSLIGIFGIENLCLFLRGMKGISIDMRQQPDKFEKACQVVDETRAIAEQMLANGVPKGPSAFGFYALMLAHNFLNLKQFERFYWPQLKKMLDAAQTANSSVYIFAEGQILRFADYLKDYPKGVIAIHLENDDVFEVRKALPNVCVVGGMSTEMLGYETAEKCVSYAKFLCDELGKNGGFCLSQNKMMSYKNDAKAANLKAVCDFVADYHF